MKIKCVRLVTAMLLLLTWGAGAAEGNGPSATALAYSCAGCHGTDGSSVGPVNPYIANMNPEYFVDVMLAYQEDENNPTIMNRIAKAYTEEQIKGMAEFFAQQKRHLIAQEYDAEQAKLGAKLHDDYCEKCHEGGGMEPSDSGTLAGQWMPYLHYTMADFLSADRRMPKKMRHKVEDVLDAHGEEGIDSLIQYYGSAK